MQMQKNWILLAMLACVASANADEGSGGVTTTIADAQASASGMDFDVYIRLRKGMTVGELLERAGPPDYQTVDGSVGHKEGVVSRRASDSVSVHSTELIAKTFYYFPTAANPFTTVVTTTGGRITNLQRERKF
jgi:hypothetical protein